MAGRLSGRPDQSRIGGMMGHFKDATLQFDSFPAHVILDCEEIFWKTRAAITRITSDATIDWDAFFQQLFQGVTPLERRWPPQRSMDDLTLQEISSEMANGDLLFENNTLNAMQRDLLQKVIFATGLQLKEKLLYDQGYFLGHFPYSFRTMISDGCLFFSKNESIYDSQVCNFGY
jgi:hypothetical protein